MAKPTTKCPLDLIPGKGLLAYSTSQLLAGAYDGPIIRINGRDWEADNRGLLPLGRISRWLNGAEARVDVLYDQSPTGAHMRWGAERPLLTLAGQGGRPQLSGSIGYTTLDGLPYDRTRPELRGPTFKAQTDQLSYLMVSKGTATMLCSGYGENAAGFAIRGGLKSAVLDMYSWAPSPWWGTEAGGDYGNYMKEDVAVCLTASAVWEGNYYNVSGTTLPMTNSDQWPTASDVGNYKIGPMVDIGPLVLNVSPQGATFQCFMAWFGYNEDEIVAPRDDQIVHFHIDRDAWKVQT